LLFGYIGWEQSCSLFLGFGGFDDFSYKSIVVEACSNKPNAKSCQQTKGKKITINRNGQKWKTVNLSSGSKVVSGLESSRAGLVSLSLKNLATYCNGSNKDASCKINFKDLGLKFSSQKNGDADIANQIAGEAIKNLYLRALKDDGKGTCEALDIPTPTFKLGADCINPGRCGSALPFKVNEKTLGKDTATAEVRLKKVATGVFELENASYGDAGQIRLHAKYIFNKDVEASGESNIFTVRPDRFLPQAINSKNQSLLERSGGGLKNTQVAGESFKLDIRAVNAQGQDTINYVASNSTQMKVTRSMPNDNTGFEGKFTYAEKKSLSSALSPAWQNVKLALFSNGISSNKVNYSEVGAIKINVQDTDYYGMTISMNGLREDTAGVEIGRFIPAEFEMIVGEVNNYIDTGDVSFTYMGQEKLGFKYKIEARNHAGDVTKNYDGDVLYDTSNKQAEVLFYGDSDGINLQSRLSDFAGNWCNGIYQSGSCAIYTADIGLFIRNPNGQPDGPFINVYYGLNIVDRDGVELADRNMSFDSVITAKRFSEDKSELRYGRWAIDNGYGPIDQNFPVTMKLEYFNGKTFITNTDDSKTVFNVNNDAPKLIDISLGKPLPTFSNSSGDVPFISGATQELMIKAPKRSGEIRLDYSVDDWLDYDWSNTGVRDPNAVISFGFYRGHDRVIYRRRLN